MGFWWQPKPVGGPAGNTYCLLYEEVELLSSWSSSSSSSVWAGTFWGVLNVLLNISENHDCHFYFWNQHQYQCQVDEGNVEIVRILGFSSTTPDLRPDVEEFRYPRFFSPQQRVFRSPWSLSQGWHPKCHVHITDAKVHSVQQTGGTSISLCLEVQHSLELIQVVDVESYDLRTSLTTSFPWLEYIVRVGWTDDGTHIWAQVGHLQRISAMLNFCKKNASFQQGGL